MRALPNDYVLVCPECQAPAHEDHNSFWCNRCQRNWPKGKGHEEYRKKSNPVVKKPSAG